jgi:hypothetical protein
MTRPSRRTVLCATASLVALSAGCIADEAGTAPGDGDDGDDGDGPDTNETDPKTNESEDPDPEPGTTVADLPDGVTDAETHPFRYPVRSRSPDVALLRDRDHAENWLAERDRRPRSIDGFVEDTDFETSVLVALEAGAPNPCHELALESLDVDDDALVLEGAVRESSEEGADACITQETTVGRLVRATFEGTPPSVVSATIVDRNGRTHGIGVATESTSASASDGHASGD